MSAVGEIALQQLGTSLSRINAMIGVKTLRYMPQGVEIVWKARAKGKVNSVKITLDLSDTYTLEFARVGRTVGRKVVETLSDVYSVDLTRTFQDVTGLCLTL